MKKRRRYSYGGLEEYVVADPGENVVFETEKGFRCVVVLHRDSIEVRKKLSDRQISVEPVVANVVRIK